MMKILGVLLLVSTATLVASNDCPQSPCGLTPEKTWITLVTLSVVIVVQFAFILKLIFRNKLEKRSDEVGLIKGRNQTAGEANAEPTDAAYDETRREHIYEPVIYDQITSPPGVRYTKTPHAGYERIRNGEQSPSPRTPAPNNSRQGKPKLKTVVQIDMPHGSPINRSYETLTQDVERQGNASGSGTRRNVEPSRRAGGRLVGENTPSHRTRILTKVEHDLNDGYEVPSTLTVPGGSVSVVEHLPVDRATKPQRLDRCAGTVKGRAFANLDRPIQVTLKQNAMARVGRSRREEMKRMNASLPRLDNEQLLSTFQRSISTSLLDDTDTSY